LIAPIQKDFLNVLIALREEKEQEVSRLNQNPLNNAQDQVT
jgi:hypothetical protein